MAYRVRYTAYYRELKTNILWQADILERDYTGSSEEIICSSNAVSIEYRPEDDNDYDWIRPSVCTLYIISTTRQKFKDFFTSDNRKYKLNLYRDSAKYWTGYAIPETYNEPFIDVNYEVSISFTDGLLSLKNVDWQAVGKEPSYIIDNYTSFMKGIERCLNKLDLPDVDILDASYIYESRFNSDNDDSPLTQTYFNTTKYFSETGSPEKCYNVLKDILQAQNCQIWMSGGCWNISPQNARKGAYVRRRYKWALTSRANGSYYAISSTVFSTDTYDPITQLDNVNTHFWDDPQLNFRPGWKALNSFIDYGFNSNILAKRIPILTSGFKGGLTNDGLVIMQNHYNQPNKGADEYLEYNIGTIPQGQILKIKFTGRGQIETKIKAFVVGSATYYLEGETGDWRQSQDFCVYDDNWYDVSKQDEIISNACPVSGVLKVRIYAGSKAGAPTVGEYTNNYKLTDFSIELVTLMNFYESNTVETAININNYHKEEINLSFCDIPESLEIWLNNFQSNGTFKRFQLLRYFDADNSRVLYRNALFVKVGESYELTNLWSVKGLSQFNRLANVISDEIAVNHIDPQYIISASIYGVFDYGTIIAIEDKKYMILRGKRITYDNEWEVELFEISDTAQGYIKLRTSDYIKTRTGGKIKTQ